MGSMRWLPMAAVGLTSAAATAAALTLSDKSDNTMSVDKSAPKRRLEDRLESFRKQRSLLREQTLVGSPWDTNWDFRDPMWLTGPCSRGASASELEEFERLLEQQRSRAKRVLILVRHGQYVNREEDALNVDPELTSLGHEQAKLSGIRLQNLLEKYRNEEDKEVDVKVITSTMKRALETANDIMDQLKPSPEFTECSMIQEGAPVVPEPVVSKALWDPEPHAFWEDGARIEAGFRRHVHRASPDASSTQIDVLVCHGNVIRYFVCRALQLPEEAWLRFSVHNASITVLTIRPSGRVSLSALGEVGHLPPEKLTFN